MGEARLGLARNTVATPCVRWQKVSRYYRGGGGAMHNGMPHGPIGAPGVSGCALNWNVLL